jgi:hypothetical protein
MKAIVQQRYGGAEVLEFQVAFLDARRPPNTINDISGPPAGYRGPQ